MDARQETGMDDAAIDFAIAAVREESLWQVSALPPRAGSDLESFLHALRQQGGETGTIGFVSIAEDFFVAARVHGEDTRLVLSDVTCVPDWPLAAEVLKRLGLHEPEGVELEESTPAGDLEIFADLGLPSMELAMLCEDLDLYPDEQIGTIASRLGFGDQYESTVDANLG